MSYWLSPACGKDCGQKEERWWDRGIQKLPSLLTKYFWWKNLACSVRMTSSSYMAGSRWMRSCTSANLDLSTVEEGPATAVEVEADPPGGVRDDCCCECGGVRGRTALLLKAPAAAAAVAAAAVVDDAETEFGAKGLPPPELAFVAFALEG